jgi:hypothetical protein
MPKTPIHCDQSRTLVAFNSQGTQPTWRGKTLTDVEPLDVSCLASVSLFVSGRQVGDFQLKMLDWAMY